MNPRVPPSRGSVHKFPTPFSVKLWGSDRKWAVGFDATWVGANLSIKDALLVAHSKSLRMWLHIWGTKGRKNETFWIAENDWAEKYL